MPGIHKTLAAIKTRISSISREIESDLFRVQNPLVYKTPRLFSTFSKIQLVCQFRWNVQKWCLKLMKMLQLGARAGARFTKPAPCFRHLKTREGFCTRNRSDCSICFLKIQKNTCRKLLKVTRFHYQITRGFLYQITPGSRNSKKYKSWKLQKCMTF